MVIDLRGDTNKASKNIVDVINSMAKIKQEQIKIERATMLKDIEREKDTAQALDLYKKKKGVEHDYQTKSLRSYMDAMKDRKTTANAPQTPTPENKLPAMSMAGGGVGDVTGQFPSTTSTTSTKQPVWRGIPLVKPKAAIYMTPGGPKSRNLTSEDDIYEGIYNKVINGENINKGEEKILLRFNKEEKEFEKMNTVFGNVQQGGIFNKRNGDIDSFNTKENAKMYIQSELGRGWEKKYPEETKILDSKYGPDKFPSHIKSRREAIRYLVDVVGMENEEAAIEYLKNN